MCRSSTPPGQRITKPQTSTASDASQPSQPTRHSTDTTSYPHALKALDLNLPPSATSSLNLQPALTQHSARQGKGKISHHNGPATTSGTEACHLTKQTHPTSWKRLLKPASHPPDQHTLVAPHPHQTPPPTTASASASPQPAQQSHHPRPKQAADVSQQPSQRSASSSNRSVTIAQNGRTHCRRDAVAPPRTRSTQQKQRERDSRTPHRQGHTSTLSTQSGSVAGLRGLSAEAGLPDGRTAAAAPVAPFPDATDHATARGHHAAATAQLPTRAAVVAPLRESTRPPENSPPGQRKPDADGPNREAHHYRRAGVLGAGSDSCSGSNSVHVRRAESQTSTSPPAPLAAAAPCAARDHDSAAAARFAAESGKGIGNGGTVSGGHSCGGAGWIGEASGNGGGRAVTLEDGLREAVPGGSGTGDSGGARSSRSRSLPARASLQHARSSADAEAELARDVHAFWAEQQDLQTHTRLPGSVDRHTLEGMHGLLATHAGGEDAVSRSVCAARRRSLPDTGVGRGRVLAGAGPGALNASKCVGLRICDAPRGPGSPRAEGHHHTVVRGDGAASTGSAKVRQSPPPPARRQVPELAQGHLLVADGKAPARGVAGESGSAIHRGHGRTSIVRAASGRSVDGAPNASTRRRRAGPRTSARCGSPGEAVGRPVDVPRNEEQAPMGAAGQVAVAKKPGGRGCGGGALEADAESAWCRSGEGGSGVGDSARSLCQEGVLEDSERPEVGAVSGRCRGGVRDMHWWHSAEGQAEVAWASGTGAVGCFEQESGARQVPRCGRAAREGLGSGAGGTAPLSARGRAAAPRTQVRRSCAVMCCAVLWRVL